MCPYFAQDQCLLSTWSSAIRIARLFNFLFELEWLRVSSTRMDINKILVNMVILIYLLLSLHLIQCYSIQDDRNAASRLTEDEVQRTLTNWLMSNKNTQSALNNMRLTSSDITPTAVDLQQVEFERIPASINEDSLNFDLQHSSCQLVQIVHLLHHSGCQPKAIVSFACTGSCPSYVQMSNSKFWRYERSCSCCQQTGLQEATFSLDCPSLDPPFKKVKTYAPIDCMCRACTDLGKENLQPQELIEALAGETMKSANDDKLS